MPYTPVNFQDGVTPLNAATMNKLDDALEDLYTNPAAALTYEGDHVPATSYQDGDIVVKDGIAYLCVGGPTTQAPNPVPWGPAGMMGGYIKTTDRGVANGVASLDATTHVPAAQMPWGRGVEFIAEIDLTTTRRFTGIQAKGYESLKLIIGGARSSAAPTNSEICMRLNDKTDTNYDKFNILAWSNAITLSKAYGQTSLVIGYLPGSGTPGYVAGWAEISIPGCALGQSRQILGQANCTANFDDATNYFVQVGGTWRYGEGIDTIELSASSAFPTTFLAGTAWLYGMVGG